MSAESQAASPAVSELPHPKPRRRHWVRWLAAVPLLLFLFALLAPYILSLPAVRNWMLALVSRDLKGEVQVGDLSLGWFSPIAVHDLQISLPDGPPVIELPALAGNKPLWRLMSDRRDVDHFRLEGAKLNLVFGPEGSNLKKLFPPLEKLPEEEARRASWRRFGGQLQIVDASFSVTTPQSQQPWGVRGLNLTATLHPQTAVPDSSPVVVLEPGTLLSHTPITREMCNDALKYVAPILAKVTWAKGDISIDIDRCRLPIDTPRHGDVAGRFSIHKVEAGSSSPLVQRLAMLLGVNAQLNLAENSIVRFELHDGRAHHHDLEFGLEGARVRTSGSVGLEDQTLDLIADLPIPVAWLSERPTVQALSEQRITLAIKGTLENPQIDAASLKRSGLAALLNSLREARGGEQGAGEPGALEKMAESGLLEGGAEVLGQWRKNRCEGQRLFPDGLLGRRRRQGREEQDQTPPAVTEPAPPAEGQGSEAGSQRSEVRDQKSEVPDQGSAVPASDQSPEEVTANRPTLEEPAPERRRFRIFDRRRERRQADPEDR
jgi:hypothetical protein